MSSFAQWGWQLLMGTAWASTHEDPQLHSRTRCREMIHMFSTSLKPNRPSGLLCGKPIHTLKRDTYTTHVYVSTPWEPHHLCTINRRRMSLGHSRSARFVPHETTACNKGSDSFH